MSDVTVFFTNGKSETFVDNGRSGGSYCNSVRYEGEFAVIKDPYGKETAFPASRIEKIVHESIF